MARRSSSSARSTTSSSRLVASTASIELENEGTTRLVVVADTHSQPHPDTARHIEALAPSAILHAGDIGDLSVIDELAKLAPVHAVRGNIDERIAELPDSLTIDLTRGGESVLRLFLTHIAVAGPRIRADAAKLARDARAAVIVCGHSHVPFLAQERGLAVFNPGSVGPRRFTLPIVFGTIEISQTEVKFAHINVENGLRWSPP